MATKEKEIAVIFVVAQPLKHNGTYYQVGETITLSEDEARELLNLEVVNVLH